MIYVLLVGVICSWGVGALHGYAWTVYFVGRKKVYVRHQLVDIEKAVWDEVAKDRRRFFIGLFNPLS